MPALKAAGSAPACSEGAALGLSTPHEIKSKAEPTARAVLRMRPLSAVFRSIGCSLPWRLQVC